MVSGGFCFGCDGGAVLSLLTSNPGMLPPLVSFGGESDAPWPLLFCASYLSRHSGAALSASQKMVPAPIRSGGDLENAFHFSAVVQSKRAFSASVPAMYFGHFRDHVRNTSSPS